MSRAAVVAGLCVAAWGGLVAAGFAAWEQYDATPGSVGPEPAPAAASGFDYEVVMFVHPHCPCSRASVAELDGLLAGCGPRVGVRVVLVRPPGAAEGWERGELWDRVAASPRFRVDCDAGGEEARRAGATTAGHTVAYDAAGGVVFRGGITRGRGREGDNPGRRALAAVLAAEEPEARQTPVFGCPLFDAGACDKPTGREGDCECRR